MSKTTHEYEYCDHMSRILAHLAAFAECKRNEITNGKKVKINISKPETLAAAITDMLFAQTFKRTSDLIMGDLLDTFAATLTNDKKKYLIKRVSELKEELCLDEESLVILFEDKDE